MPIADAMPLPNRRQWTRAEYNRAWQSGVFGETRVELIEGEIIEKSPRTPQRCVVITLVNDELWQIFKEGHVIRSQMPFVVDEFSEPEPDVAVVVGTPRDSPTHPTSALLAVQVSTGTLADDLGIKAALFAQANVSEYWVIDINNRLIHVHRVPVASASLPNGFGYQTVMHLTETDLVSPLAAPNSSIPIADLLP